MTRARRMAALILLGVAVLVLAIIVLATNREPDIDMLASAAVGAGLAIIVGTLPVNGNGKSN